MAIACSCHGIRDAELTDVIRDGACSVDEVIDVLLAIEGALGAAPAA